ncbi:Segregation and condensation protein A [Sedimentisphaera cyanobacteriorum]|uniref:Segregation and condensation protein A n=1 Tax=Sedimentisphaera cyanobacteriorum TaxID=1940790 RepID=A0A1Q2HP56_9BACT|nr:segregation/condensation protein A [Sedimentisphaera cyanobacteriorum]AQQ09074.1 Segregation and condensation protein A [Sedimentisphaera cyanobacteriorum]
MAEYHIELENIFTGPMDLLLYLVKKDEVDIYDIPIREVTEQYLHYVEMLEKLDTDLAGDFLVMAATLMEIKSAMLLPKTVPEEEGGEEEDPRNKLVKQLLEYKRFKDAANILETRAQEHLGKHKRPDTFIKRLQPSDEERELDLEEVSVWTLLETFDSLLKATGRYRDYSLIKDETPIDEYEVEILGRLQQEGPLTFEHIFDGRTSRLSMAGMFLALLELIRDALVWAEQSESTDIIYIRALTDEPAEQAVSNIITGAENEEIQAAEQ